MAMLQNFSSSFHPSIKISPLKIHIFTRNCVKPRKHYYYHSFQISCNYTPQKLVLEFDPKIPIEEAITPPSSWYTDSCFYTHELNKVFFKGWQSVGYTEQIKEPRQYFTGRLGNVEYVVCRDDGGKIHAFHNVCRHHASLLASGSGKNSCFVCPYHGWTYGLDGALLKATGINNFRVNEMGLVPLRVAIWGPFILVNFENGVLPKEEADDIDLVGNEWLGNSSQILTDGGVDSSLSFLCRREYTIECYALQIEDMKICEAVESPAYCSGPYVPQVDKAVHHFHTLLYQTLSN